MTLIVPDDLDAVARQRDRTLRDAEAELADASADAMRLFLRRIREAALPSLTAANPPLPRATSDLFTLGQMHQWWEEAVDEHVAGAVARTWAAGRAASTDLPASSRSAEAAGAYLANVRDRLSRTAQPTIPEQAFNTVRVALADEISRGSTTAETARRLAAELQWTGEDVGFWTQRRDQLTSEISRVLDPLGPPGTEARETARLTDPLVRQLQQQRSDVVQRLDRDASQWQTRAERIARTETTGAFNAGAEVAYVEENAGAKMWIATGDDRTRDTHLQAHGDCVPVNDAFTVGSTTLMFPGDPSGPAGEVINCRCTTVAGASCEELTGIAQRATERIDAERAARDGAPVDPDGPRALGTDEVDVAAIDPDDPAPGLPELDPDDPIVSDDLQMSEREWQRDVLGSQEGWADDLTPDEVQAMQDYAGSGNYRTVNAGLREGQIDAFGADSRQIVDNLDSAIDKSFLQGGRDFDGDLVVFRTFDDPALMSRLAAGEDVIGSVISDAAYVSTSASKAIADSLVQQTATGAPISGPRIVTSIDVPRGAKGAVLDAAGLGAGEREILLPRGSRFEIVRAGRSGNRIEMAMRLVLDD